MKTIIIDHPLRRISYKIKGNGMIVIPHEAESLDNYRLAHDQVWHMKLLFEREKGASQLALIDLNKLDEERQNLLSTLAFFKEEVDLSSKALYMDLEVKFQVELRDFYNKVIAHHQRTIRFYDRIADLEKEYIAVTDTYVRAKIKPIDPLDFRVLESVFRHHDDMQVDVVSLDKDLQQFLATLSDVYLLMDAYIQQYGVLYQQYGQVLHSTAQLTQDAQVLNVIWEKSV